jgi:putative ABC transport system substrate-binding protein
MNRRAFLLLLSGVMTAPRAPCAQQRAPVIGFFAASGVNVEATVAFRQGLSETGWVDGQNLGIEYRWAEGHYDRLPTFAAEFVGRKVDLILATGGNHAALAAKNVTATISIVSSLATIRWQTAWS